jgi:hypothetical protein
MTSRPQASPTGSGRGSSRVRPSFLPSFLPFLFPSSSSHSPPLRRIRSTDPHSLYSSCLSRSARGFSRVLPEHSAWRRSYRPLRIQIPLFVPPSSFLASPCPHLAIFELLLILASFPPPLQTRTWSPSSASPVPSRTSVSRPTWELPPRSPTPSTSPLLQPSSRPRRDTRLGSPLLDLQSPRVLLSLAPTTLLVRPHHLAFPFFFASGIWTDPFSFACFSPSRSLSRLFDCR